MTRQLGRPSTAPGPRFDEGKLYALFVDRLPAPFVENGRLDVAKLAAKLKVSRMTIYRWMNDSKLSLKGTRLLTMKLSDDPSVVPLSKEEVIPFLLA